MKRRYELSSDHYLVEVKIIRSNNNKREKQRSAKEFENIRSYKLQDDDIKYKYQQELNMQIKKLGCLDLEDLEALWTIFKNEIVNAAKKYME